MFFLLSSGTCAANGIAECDGLVNQKMVMPMEDLYEPATRDAYKGNLAQYLVDLHDARSTFDFCGVSSSPCLALSLAP